MFLNFVFEMIDSALLLHSFSYKLVFTFFLLRHLQLQFVVRFIICIIHIYVFQENKKKASFHHILNMFDNYQLKKNIFLIDIKK